MSLKERINEIADYFCGIEYFNDALIVKAKFPEKLTVIGSEELGIKVTKSEDGLWYYYGDKNEIEIEDIFDLISSTVKVYEEAKKKASLFKAKCEELKEIFGSTSLDKLENLYFAFNDANNVNQKEVKPKRKYTRHKKDENKVIENVTENESC